MLPDGGESQDLGTDIRNDIGAALDTLGDTGGSGNQAEVPDPPPVADAGDGQDGTDTRTAAERARDEQGRFAKDGEKKPPDKGGKVATAPIVDGKGAPPPVVKPGEAKVLPFKAPHSWRPAAREELAKASPLIQAEVTRRERETTMALQRAAETEKAHGQFRTAVQPFEHAIRSRGGDVIPTITNLLQTAEALYSAPAPMKAQIIARMIQNFDVPVETIAAALNGAPAPTGQGAQHQELRDPRLDKFLQQQEEQTQQRLNSIRAHYDTQVEEWAAEKPYFEDVREEMADLMESAGKRGRPMTFDQAYKMAIQFHPDIQALEQQREEAEKARTSVTATERLRHAGSSVRNEPAGGASGGPRPGEDMRSDVMAAMAAVQGRK